MRKKIVAGNWKMNKTESETTQFIEELKKQDLKSDIEVFIAPTFVNLSAAVKMTKDSGIHVSAQNKHQSASGAFTGEISSTMLLDIGVQHVILGHSERRAYFGETDELLKEKVQAEAELAKKFVSIVDEALK